MLHHIDGQPLLIVEACSLFALIVLAACLIVIQKHKKEGTAKNHEKKGEHNKTSVRPAEGR